MSVARSYLWPLPFSFTIPIYLQIHFLWHPPRSHDTGQPITESLPTITPTPNPALSNRTSSNDEMCHICCQHVWTLTHLKHGKCEELNFSFYLNSNWFKFKYAWLMVTVLGSAAYLSSILLLELSSWKTDDNITWLTEVTCLHKTFSIRCDIWSSSPSRPIYYHISIFSTLLPSRLQLCHDITLNVNCWHLLRMPFPLREHPLVLPDPAQIPDPLWVWNCPSLAKLATLS